MLQKLYRVPVLFGICYYGHNLTTTSMIGATPRVVVEERLRQRQHPPQRDDGHHDCEPNPWGGDDDGGGDVVVVAGVAVALTIVDDDDDDDVHDGDWTWTWSEMMTTTLTGVPKNKNIQILKDDVGSWSSSGVGVAWNEHHMQHPCWWSRLQQEQPPQFPRRYDDPA